MAASKSARSRDVESEATRRAILVVAEKLIASGGEAGLSIRELCARAGVTAPTIYHHFGSKSALIERVVDDRFSDFDRSFAKLAVPPDPVEALRWAFDRYFEYGVRHPRHYRLLFETHQQRPTPGGQRSYDGLRRAVSAIHAAGRLVEPVEAATAAFWSAVHGVTSLAIRGFSKADAHVVSLVRDAMITQLTRPLRARSDKTPRARGKEKTRHAKPRT
jgi:AcrR family transcriptional regulator